MVLYSALSILLDLTAATLWVVKKTANGIYYLVYGEDDEEEEPREIHLETTMEILKNQNKKIIHLQNTVIELTKYIVDNKVESDIDIILENPDNNIGSDFIDLKKDIV